MDSANLSNKTVGVIGAGSFGSAVANLLSENVDVLLYTRKQRVVEEINSTHKNGKWTIHNRVEATNNIEDITSRCNLIFPVVPSDNFGEMLTNFAPFLKPSHILIHATKGLYTAKKLNSDAQINKSDVYTMSELILEKTSVVRVGCMAGPNLAKELAEEQPAATVIASKFDEVIREGSEVLESRRFRVFTSNEIEGVELAGVLKNYVAIASGMLTGLGYGENARAMLITRGMVELIYIAKSLGYNEKPFLGIAGIGDLIATCNSPNSRNYRVGLQLSKGKNLQEIIEDIGEVAEGVKTLQIVKSLEHYGFTAPLANILHRIVFEGFPVEKGLELLMKFPTNRDAEYI